MDVYTVEEILTQPKTWKAVLANSQSSEAVFNNKKDIWTQKDFVFIGCGTSYYLSLVAANLYAKITDKKTKAITASDILFYPGPIFTKTNQGYANFLISRSGTTTEVLLAAEKIKTQFSFPTCAISCRPESKLVKICDNHFLVPEADEKSVVMTRSFTSMLLLIQLLASFHSGNKKYMEELSKLPEKGEVILDNYDQLAKDIIEKEDLTKFVYLGQGPFYGLACESMLKIKEMALVSSEAYHSFEFRHGPMSTADEKMLITFLISDQAYKQEVVLLKEMKELGAKTLAICEKADKELSSAADYILELNSGVSDFARLILYMPITQLLGYYKAKSKGLDPDNPKNLTQVVEIK